MDIDEWLSQHYSSLIKWRQDYNHPLMLGIRASTAQSKRNTSKTTSPDRDGHVNTLRVRDVFDSVARSTKGKDILSNQGSTALLHNRDRNANFSYNSKKTYNNDIGNPFGDDVYSKSR